MKGFATSEVQINETETPCIDWRLFIVWLVERLGTADSQTGAFRSVIDGWFFALEQDVLADGRLMVTNKSCWSRNRGR